MLWWILRGFHVHDRCNLYNNDWVRALTNNDVLKHSSSINFYMLVLYAESIPLPTVWTQIRPNKVLGLIWVQSVWHTEKFLKTLILHPKKLDEEKSWKLFRHAKILSVVVMMSLWMFATWKKTCNMKDVISIQYIWKYSHTMAGNQT